MRFNQLTVYVDYRMNAGNGQPKWKALRARIKQQTAEGMTLGSDLTRQGITDPQQIIQDSLCAIMNMGIEVQYLRFEFSKPLLNAGQVNKTLRLSDGRVTFDSIEVA